MNPEIKDRIEKIRDDMVPKGYKKTKIGIIPVEWELLILKEILKKFRLGGNYQNTENVTEHPLIKMGNIGRSFIKLEKIEYIPDLEEINNKDILKHGDLLFNTRNTLDLVGKVAIWRNELPIAYYNSNLMKLIFNKFVYSSLFMNYLFNSFAIIKRLRRIAIGTTSVAAIYTRDLLKVKFELPPLTEQSRIAEILSTCDKAIELKEKLIEQKKQQKKGLMQLLLTGKKRAINSKTGKPFKGEWQEVKLGEVAEIRMGQSPPSKSYNILQNGLPLIQGNADIKNRKTINRIYTTKTTIIALEDDIIMTVRAPVGFIALASNKSCIGRGVCAISPEINRNYLFNYFICNENKWKKYSQGSTFEAINSKDIRNFKLIIPELTEQKTISSILSKADKEIDHLGKELEQLKEQKRGLMQLLLTGVVRVK